MVSTLGRKVRGSWKSDGKNYQESDEHMQGGSREKNEPPNEKCNHSRQVPRKRHLKEVTGGFWDLKWHRHSRGQKMKPRGGRGGEDTRQRISDEENSRNADRQRPLWCQLFAMPTSGGLSLTCSINPGKKRRVPVLFCWQYAPWQHVEWSNMCTDLDRQLFSLFHYHVVYGKACKYSKWLKRPMVSAPVMRPEDRKHRLSAFRRKVIFARSSVVRSGFPGHQSPSTRSSMTGSPYLSWGQGVVTFTPRIPITQLLSSFQVLPCNPFQNTNPHQPGPPRRTISQV